MNSVTVATTTGRLRGQSADGVSVFKGVPYAAPPVGDAPGLRVAAGR